MNLLPSRNSSERRMRRKLLVAVAFLLQHGE